MSVDDVKFVNGDEKLKVLTDALRSVRCGQTVPDGIALKFCAAERFLVLQP